MVLMFLLSRVSGRHLFFSPLRCLASLIYLYYVIFKEVLGYSGGNEMQTRAKVLEETLPTSAVHYAG